MINIKIFHPIRFVLPVLVFLGLSVCFNADAQTISYPGPQSYFVGVPITSILPTISGFTPAINGQTTTMGVAPTLPGASSINNLIGGEFVDPQGNLFFTEQTSVQKMTPSGVITTIAGSATSGTADGTGTAASFKLLAGIVVDASGNIYVADSQGNTIRKITPAGVVTTFAGVAGTAGYADGLGSAALFHQPFGLTIDASGNLYVADFGNRLVRKVTPTGLVSTYAGIQGNASLPEVNGSTSTANIAYPYGITADRSSNIYVSEYYSFQIRLITTSGIVSTYAGGTEGYADGTGTAAKFLYQQGVGADASGNIYVADYNCIRKISPGGIVTTLSGTNQAINQGPTGTADGIGVNATFSSSSISSVAADSSGFVNVGDAAYIRHVALGNYSISPALPPGLHFNAMTGAISGTPTAATPATTYTICGYYSTGFTSTTLSIATPLSTGVNPSQNQNYIATYVPRVSGLTTNAAVYTASSDRTQVETSIQYIDGIGRPLQTVQVKGSPAANDIVQPYTYDGYGRETTKYLPYAASVGLFGSYRPNAATSDQQTFYNAPPTGVSIITAAIAQSNMENSPLNRPVAQGSPGTTWQLGGRTKQVVYTLNNAVSWATDTVNSKQVAMYRASVNSGNGRALTASGYYSAGTLTVTISKDENWTTGRAGTVEEYKDNQGRVILKRTYNYTTSLQQLSTYYVYDDMGELAYVLPPASGADAATTISQTTLNNLCYQYRYDERNRLVQKKLPGKGWDFTVYNSIDQPVATQDSLQRTAKEWIYTKYDAMGRAVTTGIWTNGGTAVGQPALQTTLTGIATNLWEAPTTTGYTAVAWPTSSTTALTIDYYDNYTGIPALPSAYTLTSGISNMTRGLPTVKKTAVLNTPANMLWDVMYYDDLGRSKKTFSQHYLGGTLSNNNYDLDTITYNFTNAPTTVTRMHYNTSSTTTPVVTVFNKYIYDHMGRKLKNWEMITNGTTPTPAVLLSQTDYNEIGQVMTKHLHATPADSVDFLQNIAYTYNEREWLLSSTAPLFSEQLQYNSVNNVSGIAPTAQYNGNIASQTWTSSASSGSYLYKYDPMNRLISGGSTDHYDERGITYDPMGNISTLNRVYNGTVIDSLLYTYSSTNQLQSVNDRSTNAGTVGYKKGTSTYVYDGNGNMSTDNSKSITITYNLLNLPQTITAKSTTYTYDASGQKLRRVVGTALTDYINGIEYDGTSSESITFIQTEEGRALPNGTSAYNYEYNLADHLGNSRLTFDSSTGAARTEQQDNYMPFGLDITVGTRPSPQNYYLYNKKELQSSLTLYDYGARQYDPVLGRWLQIDPAAETSRRWSPYNYVMNNPIRLIDPDGMMSTIPGHDDNGVAMSDAELEAQDYAEKQAMHDDSYVVAQLNQIATGLNNSLNYAWNKSKDGTNQEVEVGFDVTSDDQNYYAEHFHTGDEGHIYPTNKADKGEKLIGNVHTHPYKPNDGFIDGAGPSGPDINALRYVMEKNSDAGTFIMVEAGNTRYAIAVTDPKLAQEFFKNNDRDKIIENYNKAFSDPKNNNVSFRQKIILSIKAVVGDGSRTGITAYMTNDSVKQNFEHL